MSNTESSLDNNEVQYKKCCTCKEVKQLLFFSKNKKERDGMQSECKSCQKVRRDARIAVNPNYFNVSDKEKKHEYYINNAYRLKEYRAEYYKENKDRLREVSKAYYEANKEKHNETCRKYYKENKEKLAEYYKARYHENIDSEKKRQKEYRIANKEKIQARHAERYQQNKEYFRAAWHKRRARLRNADGSHTKEDIQFILEKQKGKCVTCAVCITTDYSVDHITPLSKGGSNNKDNIQLLCKSCNSSKGNKDPIEFMQTLGYLC